MLSGSSVARLSDADCKRASHARPLTSRWSLRSSSGYRPALLVCIQHCAARLCTSIASGLWSHRGRVRLFACRLVQQRSIPLPEVGACQTQAERKGAGIRRIHRDPDLLWTGLSVQVPDTRRPTVLCHAAVSRAQASQAKEIATAVVNGTKPIQDVLQSSAELPAQVRGTRFGLSSSTTACLACSRASLCLGITGSYLAVFLTAGASPRSVQTAERSREGPRSHWCQQDVA